MDNKIDEATELANGNFPQEPVVTQEGGGAGPLAGSNGPLPSGSNGDDEVHANTVQVNGVVRDAAGNTWTIPEEDTQDFLYKSPFDIKKEPDFYYQFEHKDNVAQMMTEGFKPVTRREIGLQGFTPIGEYGVNVDSVYQIHDLVCIKIPEVLNERRLKALQKVCDAAVAQTVPTKDGKTDDGPIAATLAATRTARTKDAAEAAERMRTSPMARYDQKHTVIKVKPTNPEKDVVS